MSSSVRTFLFAAVPLTLALLLPIGALGQTDAASRADSGKIDESKRDLSETRPASDLEEETAALRSKVEHLQIIVEQQQRVLAEMQKRLDAIQNVTPASAESRAAASPVSEAAATDAKETASAARPQPQAKAPGIASWDGLHASIKNGDGSFETQIGGYAQLDYRGYQSGDHPPNTMLVRRARVSVEGTVQKYYDFRVEGDFADVAGTLLRDFYLNVHRTDELQFRFGQFRVPISQEELRSDTVQDFVERSLVNNLVPSRSPGFAVTGSINKGAIEYQAGLFNGKGLLALNNNGTPEAAVRLRFAPWKNGDSFLSKGLLFGGAVTYGRTLCGSSVRGITESRSFTFFVPDTINGRYNRANAEVTWLLGPAAFRAEYDQTNQRRDNLGLGGVNLPGVVAKGGMAQFTYLLTGESKPDAGVVAPRRDLFSEGDTRGFGAWELKFRYARLQISDSTSQSNHAETFYFGPNWYLNKFVRYLLDFGYERFGDPARTPRPGDRGYFVILSRVQVAF